MMLFVKALISAADGDADCWDGETIGFRLRRRARISQPFASERKVSVQLNVTGKTDAPHYKSNRGKHASTQNLCLIMLVYAKLDSGFGINWHFRLSGANLAAKPIQCHSCFDFTYLTCFF